MAGINENERINRPFFCYSIFTRKQNMSLKKLGFNSYGAFRVGQVRVMDHAPFALLKKHTCRHCHNPLKITWISQVIGEGTPEAEGKNLLFGYKGEPVQYTFAVFTCNQCGQRTSINEQYFFEHPKKFKRYTQNQRDYRLQDDYYSYLKSLEKK